ncbi:MAG: hypothetical protein ACPIOQ_83360, partial [Promethearchaeia archaeon]
QVHTDSPGRGLNLVGFLAQSWPSWGSRRQNIKSQYRMDPTRAGCYVDKEMLAAWTVVRVYRYGAENVA